MDEIKKSINVAKCEHCGKITNISTSHTVRNMKVQNQVLSEELNMSNKERVLMRKQHAGMVASMHVIIKRLYDLMTPEQRTQASEYSQELREEFKKIKKSN